MERILALSCSPTKRQDLRFDACRPRYHPARYLRVSHDFDSKRQADVAQADDADADVGGVEGQGHGWLRIWLVRIGHATALPSASAPRIDAILLPRLRDKNPLYFFRSIYLRRLNYDGVRKSIAASPSRSRPRFCTRESPEVGDRRSGPPEEMGIFPSPVKRDRGRGIETFRPQARLAP